MNILGIELESNRLAYVYVRHETSTYPRVLQRGKLEIGSTRDASDIRKFADELRVLLGSLSPEAISVKAKPESGQMRAGAAALKMEAILVASTSCPVHFLTPQSLKAVEDNPDLFAYLQDAWKAAVRGFDPPAVRPKAKKKPMKADTRQR